MITSLLLALALVESSNRNLKPYMDTNGHQSFGYYGFQKARWIELGGDAAKFGKATRKEQDKVMEAEILQAQASAPVGMDGVKAICQLHNAGHIMSSSYTSKYEKKVRKLMEVK